VPRKRKRQNVSLDDIGECLRKTNRLLAAIATRDLPQVYQISLLSRIGLQPSEIADIVGTTANTVRVVLVSVRKKEKQIGRPLRFTREE
jgi:hypothetical protein